MRVNPEKFKERKVNTPSLYKPFRRDALNESCQQFDLWTEVIDMEYVSWSLRELMKSRNWSPTLTAARTFSTRNCGRMNQIPMLNVFGRSSIAAVRVVCYLDAYEKNDALYDGGVW